MLGINLSGAEFGNIGGQYGWSYIYPSAADLDYYVQRGVQLVRLPVRWERLQPTAGGELDPAEVGRLNKFLDDAKAAGVKVVVDVHNFGAYNGASLGTPGATTEQFADFWKKLATAVGTQPALTGYDLMNEPHDLPTGVWPAAAQAAVNAIRTVDTAHSIYVEGEAWGSSINWSQTNAGLDIKDPANKIIYEAHIYFDRYSSGTYQGSYDSEGAYPDIGADRIADFVKWLADRNAKGFIGEFAVPNNDPRWLTVLDKFAAAMDSAHLDGAYWGAGPWWGDYPLALRTGAGDANPQLDVIEKYFKSAAPVVPTTLAPVVAADFGPDILVGLDGAGGAITSVAPAVTAAAGATTSVAPAPTATVDAGGAAVATSGRGVSIDGFDDLIRGTSDTVVARAIKTAAPQLASTVKAAPAVLVSTAPAVVADTKIVDATHQSDAPVASAPAAKVADPTAPATQVATAVSLASDAVVKTTVSSGLSKSAAKAVAAAAAAQLKLVATHAAASDAVASVVHVEAPAAVTSVVAVAAPAVAASLVSPPVYAASSPASDLHASVLDIHADGGLGDFASIAHHATAGHMFDFMM